MQIKTFLSSHNLLKTIAVSSLALVLAPMLASAATYTTLSGQLERGDSNNNVANLQMFLAADPSIYPSGLVTGYYGALTEAAVKAFQTRYGISAVGRVGPVTLAKMNEVISGGLWAGDVSGPQFFSVGKSITRTSATFTWSTNENATAKIFYDVNPVQMNEGDINSVGFGARTGMVATNDSVSRNAQTVTINNLLPNTRYYYTLVSTDAQGNVSVWGPNDTFVTPMN